MAKYYYNGVLLPEIPVVEGYGYAAIRYDEANSRIDCIYSQTNFYYTGSTIRNTAGSSYKRYIASISNPVEWTESSDTNYQDWAIATNRRLLWSNHDIPNGSATSTTIYFYATDPVPENEAKPKELEYTVFTNFYPSGSTITYAVSDLTINYVVPVKKYSTYTVTMTEVGNRLRVCYSSIDPAVITSSVSVTSITEPSSFPAGYTFTYFAQEDGWMVVYVSNAGEYPKISIVTNGAGGDGAPLYDRKYLIRSNSTLYTITDGALSTLTETEVTASLFQTYGVNEIPDGALLVGLTDPEVLYWHDSTDELPVLASSVTGSPPVPQVVVTNPQDMSDSTILGIESVTVTASEDVLFALSFDDGATWTAYNGTAWVTLEQENSGMTAETFQNISLEAWAEVVTGTAYRVRFVLMDTTSYMTELVIHYLNKEG